MVLHDEVMMIDDMMTQSSVLTNCRPLCIITGCMPVVILWGPAGQWQRCSGSRDPHPSEMSTLGPGNVFTSAGADGNIVSVNKEGLPTPTNYQTAQQTTCSLPGPHLKIFAKWAQKYLLGSEESFGFEKKVFFVMFKNICLFKNIYGCVLFQARCRWCGVWT